MASNSVSARPVDDVRAIALTIPSRYVEDFRAAIVSEIRFEAESIVKDVARVTPDERALVERLDRPANHEEIATTYGDVRGNARLMWHDVALFDQLAETPADPAAGEVTLLVDVGDQLALEAVPHVFEAMAREIVGPRLNAALGVGPIDSDWLPKLREQIERVSWAAERAAEYHTKCAELREGVR